MQIEDILGHIGELVRLSEIRWIDVGEVEGAMSFHLDKVLNLSQLPCGHVNGRVIGIGYPTGADCIALWLSQHEQRHFNRSMYYWEVQKQE